MDKTAKDIDEAAKKIIADSYEIGATACVLVGFNSGEQQGAVIRAATGRFDQLMMLLAIELTHICKETDDSIGDALKTLKLCAKECQKLMEEDGETEGK